MNLRSQTVNVTFLKIWPNPIVKQALYWLAVILMGYLAGFVTIQLVSLLDSEYLVLVLTTSIVQAMPLTLFCYFTGLILVFHLSSIPNRIRLFTIAFLARVVISFVLSFVFQFDDERGFHAAGIEQIYGIFSLNAGRGYYHLVNMLYAVFGPNLLLPKVINVLLGSLLPFFAYDLGRQLFNDPKVGWRAFLFAAFLPPLVVYSALNLKEIATAFLLVLTLWFVVVDHRYGMWKIAGAVASMGTLYWLRGAPWAAIAIPGIVTYIIFGKNWQFSRLLRLRLWLKIVFVISLSVFFLLPFFIEPITQTVLSRLMQETYFIERFTESQATVMQFVDLSNPLSLKNLGILFLRGLFSPSPFRFFLDYGLDTVIEAFNMLTWYLLFPFALVGFLAERQKGAIVACSMTVLGILIMATMGIMVGSDPYRHRISMLGLLFVLAGGGLKKEAYRSHRWVFYLWWFGAFAFTAVWIRFRA